MPCKDPKKRAFYHEQYDKAHRDEISRRQKERRAEQKLIKRVNSAKFDFELKMILMQEEIKNG